MIPDQAEVYRSLYGAYRLARLDPRGMLLFNLTFEGFWRSFFAAVLVAPAYAILIAERLAGREETLDLGRVILVQGGAYVLSWAAFPIAAIVLTRMLGLGSHYSALIIAANWAAVLQVGVFFAALVVSLVLSNGLGNFLLMVVTFAILFYQWFIFRTALETTGGTALALLMVDLILNTAINVTADRFM
jgi:hypothetical protein